MGSRSGSDSGGGGNDMQVSGMEAALSTEKGISTAADTRVSNTSFSRSNDEIVGRNEIDYVDNQGNLRTTTIGYGEGQVDPNLAQARLGADTSTVGIASDAGIDRSGNFRGGVNRDYSDSEIEKGYTDDGQILANVNGTYMTKSEMYNKGIIEKDPVTGRDVMGRNTVDPDTGELVRTDLSFKEHLANSPVKFSPLLSVLYAGSKNLQEYNAKKNFMGFNEAGQRGKLGNASLGYGASNDSDRITPTNTGDSDRDNMNFVTPALSYAVGGSQPQASMVNNYQFANTNMSDVQKAYDQAKNNLNMILTPTNQQFGYSDPPYGGYTMADLTNNPFNIDYLKTRGLI
jgi:hypothetical protein